MQRSSGRIDNSAALLQPLHGPRHFFESGAVMGIRITDQPSDQHTQNPPPEQDPTLGEGQTKTVASVIVDAPAATPTVLRGAHHVEGLCLIQESDIPTITPRASRPGQIGTPETDTQSNVVAVSALGWVRRDTGATVQVGAVEDHIVRKLPPRWSVAPTSGSDQVTAEQNKISR
jgi:hypothetical protein